MTNLCTVYAEEAVHRFMHMSSVVFGRGWLDTLFPAGGSTLAPDVRLIRSRLRYESKVVP